jgi:pSer/pThr/pTyr-binding forkhead associated (FHA) protein
MTIDMTALIWVIPGFLGVITAVLLLYWFWLTIAPGPRVRDDLSAPLPQEMPQPRRMPQPTLPIETDDTIIDRIPTPAGGSASLIIESGLPPATIPFPGNEFRIGRFRDEAQNILVALDEKSVSRSHALIRSNPQTGEYYIQDAGSRFGTFIVNAQGGVEQLPQGQMRRITDGTVIRFGSAVYVRLSVSAGGFQMPADFDPGMTRL